LLIPAARVVGAAPEVAPTELSDEQKEQFLRDAKIVKTKGIKTGTTGTSRATMSDGTLVHDAHIQTIDIYKHEYRTVAGLELNFRDSYKFNIAAYRVDRLVNLNMVPVSVERKIKGKPGSVTWWMDDVQMMEVERYKKKIPPPNMANWLDQMCNVRLFNELVYNSDPTLGNLLITDDWRIGLVDFSRAFRISKDLRKPENLSRVDRRVYEGLKGLTRDVVARELGPLLRESEIEGLLARRDKIVRFFDEAAAEKGEAFVICNREGH
jgi:hypothetical protein